MNPLGVTIVTYKPKTQTIREMLVAASRSYVELKAAFDAVMNEF